MGLIHNNPAYNQLRRKLRNEVSPVEAKLWLYLKGKNMQGLKFRRQHGVGPFVVDYYCPELRLAIEIDGDSHFDPDAIQRDERRTDFLNQLNISVIRFTNKEVLDSIEGVVENIEKKVKELKKMTPPLTPPRKGGDIK